MEKPRIPVDLIVAKLAEDAEKAQVRAQKASDVLLQELDTEIAPTPYEILYEEDRFKLKHYQPIVPIQYKHPLLLVYALINRETMLDLQPGRSVVQSFLQNGIDLYMIDWGYPSRKDRYLTIDDHVNGYMDNIVDFIRERISEKPADPEQDEGRRTPRGFKEDYHAGVEHIWQIRSPGPPRGMRAIDRQRRQHRCRRCLPGNRAHWDLRQFEIPEGIRSEDLPMA
jgi:hypothetical protein